MKEIPEMKDMHVENEMLKDILSESDSSNGNPLLDLWDETVGENGETLGDRISKVLDTALDVIYEKSIIINNEKYPLIEDDKFNISVLHHLFGKQLTLKTKPNWVSKLQYITAPDMYCELVEARCNETEIVFRPILSDELKDIIANNTDQDDTERIDDVNSVTMTLKDMDENDIIIFIYNANESEDHNVEHKISE